MCVFYGFTICLVISACSRWRFVPVGGLFLSEACSLWRLVLFVALFFSVAFLPPLCILQARAPVLQRSGLTAEGGLTTQWSYSEAVLQPQAVYKKSVQRYEKKLTYANFSAFLSSIFPSHRNPLIPLYSQNQTNETESRQNRARVSPRFCRVLIEPATTNGNNQRPW